MPARKRAKLNTGPMHLQEFVSLCRQRLRRYMGEEAAYQSCVLVSVYCYVIAKELGLNPRLMNCEANKSVIEMKGTDALARRMLHTVLVVDNFIIDFTAAQYFPKLKDFPVITKVRSKLSNGLYKNKQFQSEENQRSSVLGILSNLIDT